MSKLARALVLGVTLAAMTTVGLAQAVAVGGLSTSARGQPAVNAAIEWNAIASTAIMTTAGATAARRRAQLGDGARRRLRHRQCDRRRPPALPRCAAREPRGFQGGRCRDRRLPGARRVPDGDREPPLVGLVPAQRSTLQPLYEASLGAVPDGAGEGGRDRRRRSGGRRDADRPGERRPLRPISQSSRAPIPERGGRAPQPGIVADPAAWVGQRESVPRPERRDASHRRPERAHERRLCRGVRRGEAARLAHEHEADVGPDGRRDLLAGQRVRDLEPRLPCAGRRATGSTSSTVHASSR